MQSRSTMRASPELRTVRYLRSPLPTGAPCSSRTSVIPPRFCSLLRLQATSTPEPFFSLHGASRAGPRRLVCSRMHSLRSALRTLTTIRCLDRWCGYNRVNSATLVIDWPQSIVPGGTTHSHGWSVFVAIKSKSRPSCNTASPSSSAAAAKRRSGIFRPRRLRSAGVRCNAACATQVIMRRLDQRERRQCTVALIPFVRRARGVSDFGVAENRRRPTALRRRPPAREWPTCRGLPRGPPAAPRA